MRVGVLVPVYGFAPYLPEALDCVLAQPGAVEVVVVDDGSAEPVVLHPDHAGHVTLVRREGSGGPAAARASGLEALAADVGLVALCDADDAWLPGALARTCGALAAAPGAGWVFARADIVGIDGRPTGERWPELAAGRHSAATLARALYTANPVPTSSVVLTREALTRAGGFPGPVRLAEDWDLWLRLCAAGVDAVCVAETTIRYRRHPGGLTGDVAALAADQRVVHERHAALVDPHVAAAAMAADEAARAAGLARARAYGEARRAWGQVARRRPLTRAERLRRAALGIPGLRARMGRADPYC